MSDALISAGAFAGQAVLGESRFESIRGLTLHARCWGADQPGVPLVLGHGWLDTAASWQFVVSALEQLRPVYAIDWRGFGLSDWSGGDNYWFPDYVADLAAWVERVSPEQPIDLVGHSMGGQIASLYAGARPARIRRLVIVDSLVVPDSTPDEQPKRLANWLDAIEKPTKQKTYPDFDTLAERIAANHDGLTAERAAAVARGWGDVKDDGRVHLLADPVHRTRGPSLYHNADSESVWRAVTAPTLFLDAADSGLGKFVGDEELAKRRTCFADSQRVVVPNCGHMMHFDQPEAVAAELDRFFAAA